MASGNVRRKLHSGFFSLFDKNRNTKVNILRKIDGERERKMDLSLSLIIKEIFERE